MKNNNIFKQCSDSTWMINCKVKVDGEFHHFTKKGYLTKASAKADFERAKEEFIKNNTKHHQIGLFEDIIEEYKEMRKLQVDESTLSCDQSIYNVYFKPVFYGRKIESVFNQTTINGWYKEFMKNNKYTNNKKGKVVTRLKDVIKFAYYHKYIDATIYQECDTCLLPVKDTKKASSDRIAWDNEEEFRFFSSMKKGSEDYIMFRLFFHCCPRLGEFIGLKGADYNHKTHKITIGHQVKFISGKGAVYTDKLKTHDSYRQILLSNDIAEMLEDYIQSLGIEPDDFLFSSSAGRNKPFSRTTFRRRLYYYEEMAGVRHACPHCARHNGATKLANACENAMDIEVAARRLGHSPEMFLNTYAKHGNDETESSLLRKVGDA